MQTYIIKYTHGDVNGSEGFILEGTQGLDASREGRLLAHDILEHVNGLAEIGGRSDEVQALGAVLFGRTIIEDINIGYDLEREFEYFIDDASTYGHTPAQVLGDYEDEIEEALNLIDYQYHIDNMYEPAEVSIEDFKTVMRDTLRLGIQKAETKYKSSITLGSLFHKVQTELDEKLKYANEWDTITLTIDADFNVQCNITEYDFDDEEL